MPNIFPLFQKSYLKIHCNLIAADVM
nr:unnamed protein product [Callosobruchus chinensis]